VREQMDFQSDDTFSSQARVAANALSLGLSRCVSLAWPTNPFDQNWDSHVDNDDIQTELYEGVFAGLIELMDVLDSLPGEGDGSLADETTVVVFSEMGRSPQLNNLDGKNHWPYTSVLLIGADITGDRVVGAFDEYYNGSLVDPASGEITETGELPSAEMIGATLLALGDVDPSAFVSGASVLEGVLR
jgi:uncharacterized protein (DUF1501 family)